MSNVGLLQDDILGEIISSLNGAKDAGPEAMHALNTLIEACIIHDEIWINPRASFGNGGGGLLDSILEDPLIATLSREEVLKSCPNSTKIDHQLKLMGAEYDFATFFTDLIWNMDLMVYETSKWESQTNRMKAFILDKVPMIYQRKELLDYKNDPLGDDVAKLINIFGERIIEFLIQMEGWNRSVSALAELSKYLRVNLYVLPTAVPHQLGYLKNNNCIVKNVYRKINSDFDKSIELDIGCNSLSELNFPSLAAIVLSDIKGDSSVLAEAILEKRFKYRGFRKYLTEFESLWLKATTRRDRSSLNVELNNAITKVSGSHRANKDRLIYKIWGVVKNPTKLLQNIGDVFVEKGRTECIIGQVGGLRAFWKDHLNSPLHELSYQNFLKIMPSIAPDDTWEGSKLLNKYIENAIRLQE